MHIGGQLEAFVNTFGTDQTIQISPFLQPVVGFSSITIPGAVPILNTAYVNNPTTATGDVLVANTVCDPAAQNRPAACAPYFAIAAKADLLIGTDIDNPVLTLQGVFRIAVTTSSLAVDAFIITSVKIPGSSTPLFDLIGAANFGIDADGIYGRALLSLKAGTATELTPGFQLTAQFLLEFNTAAVAKDVLSFPIDTKQGTIGTTLQTISLPERTLHLSAAGSLVFSTTGSGAVELTLKGRFDFTISPTMLEISAEISLSGDTFLDADAHGGLQLSTAGIAGFIRIGVEATVGTPGTVDKIGGTGFEIAFSAAVEINTTSGPATVDGVQLAALTVKISASGHIQFSLGGVVGFRIEGSVLVSGSREDGFAISVKGLLLALVDFGAGPITLIRLNVEGDLRIRDAAPAAPLPLYTIAGRLAVSVGANSVLNGNGFTFNASLLLEVNTTNAVVHLDPNDVTKDLAAGIYVRLHAEGDLGFGVGTSGLFLAGKFDLSVGTTGLSIAANAKLEARIAGQTILRLDAVGALLINGQGIAAKIGLTLGVNALSGGTGFSFNGTFSFELNTTSQSIPTIGGVNVNLLAGPYVRLVIAGALQLGGDSTASFKLQGSFRIQGGAAGLEVAADAHLKAIVAGTTLLDLATTGALLIGKNGIAAKLSLGASFGSASTFLFTGNLTLAVNTTGQYVGSIAGQQVDLAAGTYVRIHIAGTLSVLNNSISATGTFDLTVGSTGLNVHADAKLVIFGISFNLVADVIINSSGLVIRTQIGSSFRPFDGIEISGQLMFELNTTSSPVLGIPARTVRVSVTNATVNVIGFKATGSLVVTISPNHFRIEVLKTSPLSLVIGPLNIAFYGFFDAFNGVVTFSFTATGGFHVRAGPAYLDADASLTITDHSFSFHISGAAGLEIAGIKIGISVSADVTISNNRLDVAVRGCVDLLIDTACLTVHFSLGSLDPPGASQVPPPPVLATKLSGGVLRLNIGSYASARNGFGDVTDETFIVTHVGGTKGNEEVSVSAFGLNQTYTGVSRIVVYDAGSGADYIEIVAGVLADADLSGGVGNDTLSYQGSGSATLNGGDGDDLLLGGAGTSTMNGNAGNDKLLGGSGNETLDGGSGDDSVSGGGGADTITGGTGVDKTLGGDGDDTILWRLGDGLDTIDGNAGTDRLRVTLTDSADVAAYALTTTGFTIAVSGATLGSAGIEASDLYALGGADTVTVSSVGASTLASIHILFGNDLVGETFVLNGSSSTDNFSVSVTSATVTIARSGGVSIAIDDAQSAKGGAALTLNLNDGADTVTVNQTLAGTTTTINGGSGNDAVRVGPGATVDGIAGLLIVNGGDAGSDTLQVDDLGTIGPETAFLTSSRIWGLGMPGSSEASNGITYGGIEALTLRLGVRADTVNVRSTASGATTTIFTGGTATANVVNVSSTAALTNGDLDSIAGTLVIVGESGADTVNAYDADAITATGFVSATRVWGLGMPGSSATAGGISYSGLEQLNLSLGQRADTTNVRGTASGTVTTIFTGSGSANVVNVSSDAPAASGNVDTLAGQLVVNGQSGNDTVNVDDKDANGASTGFLTATRIWGFGMPGSTETVGGITYSGIAALRIRLGERADTVNVRSTNATTVTTIETGVGSSTNTINVGSTTPVTTHAIAGTLVVVGQSSSDVVNVDDSGDTAGDTGTMTDARVTGLGMGTGGIEYSFVETLNVLLGTGPDTFNVRSTNAVTLTTVKTGTGSGPNVVNVGSASPLGNGNVNSIAGLLVVNGESAADTLNLDDTGDSLTNTGFLTSNRVWGLGMPGSTSSELGITYSSIEALAIRLGSGGDDFTILSTHTAATSLETGAGDDRVAVQSIAGTTSIDTQDGSDTVNVGSLSTPADATGNVGGNVDGIQAALIVQGSAPTSGSDVLNVDESGESDPNDGTLTSTTLTGLQMAPAGITYGGIEHLNIWLGSSRRHLHDREHARRHHRPQDGRRRRSRGGAVDRRGDDDRRRRRVRHRQRGQPVVPGRRGRERRRQRRRDPGGARRDRIGTAGRRHRQTERGRLRRHVEQRRRPDLDHDHGPRHGACRDHVRRPRGPEHLARQRR